MKRTTRKWLGKLGMNPSRESDRRNGIPRWLRQYHKRYHCSNTPEIEPRRRTYA